MRSAKVRWLASEGDAALDESFEAHVRADGARAAAWLAWKHKAKLLRDGRVLFKIPTSKATPPWFRVAIEALRRRQRWHVQEAVVGAERHTLVEWLAWGENRRHV
jgi:hypothetical protein